MSTLFVKFAARVEAEAYEAQCTAQLALLSEGAEIRWYAPRQDAGGLWVVALYGPPWIYGGATVAEPAACAALRQGAVLSDTPDWPQED